MPKYYVLKKNSHETLEIELPSKDFNDGVLETEELGLDPFSYDSKEEAIKVKEALKLIYKKTYWTFIVVEEIN